MFPYRADVAMERMPIANWVIMGLTIIISMAAFTGEEQTAMERFSLWRSDALEWMQEQEGDGVTVRYAGEPLQVADAEAPGGDEEEDVAGQDEEIVPLEDLTLKDIEEMGPDEFAARLMAVLEIDIEVWRFKGYQLLTHSFLHIGFLHLVGNMIFLWVFGNAVNAKIGNAAYASLYAVYAIIAGLAWFAMPGDGLFMLGASGAVMGVAGMFAVLYPLNQISMCFVLLFRPFFFQVSAVWVLLVYFLLDFLGTLAPGGVVANISHMAGMLAGGGVAAALLLTARVKPVDGERTLLEMMGFKVQRITRRKTAPNVSWRDNIARDVDRYSPTPGAASAAPPPPAPEPPPIEVAPGRGLDEPFDTGRDDDFERPIDLVPLDDDD